MTQSTALIVSPWFKTRHGTRIEIDRVQIESVDFFKAKRNERQNPNKGREGAYIGKIPIADTQKR